MKRTENDKRAIAIAGEWWTQRLILAGVPSSNARNIANDVERSLFTSSDMCVFLDNSQEGVLARVVQEHGFRVEIIPSDIRMNVIFEIGENAASVTVIVTIFDGGAR